MEEAALTSHVKIKHIEKSTSGESVKAVMSTSFVLTPAAASGIVTECLMEKSKKLLTKC